MRGNAPALVEALLGKNKQRLPKRVGWLLEKIADEDNLRRAVDAYCKGQRRKPERVRRVREGKERYVAAMRRALLNGEWRPRPLRRFVLRDPLSGKERVIAASGVLDNIVQTAIVQVLEPILYRSAYMWSACNIKGKGIAFLERYIRRFSRKEEAVRMRYERAGKRYRSPVQNYLKFDIRKFYEHIKPELVERLLRKRIKDERVITLVMTFVRQNEPDGLCIGGRISHVLANYVGERVCRFIKERGFRYLAVYMDDFVVWGTSKAKLHALRRELAEYMAAELGLEIKGNWFVAPWEKRGCDFVGFIFHRDGRTRIRKRIRWRIIKLLRKFARRKATRKDARSLLSYWGYIVHTRSFYLFKKHGGGIALKTIKSKARQQ